MGWIIERVRRRQRRAEEKVVHWQWREFTQQVSAWDRAAAIARRERAAHYAPPAPPPPTALSRVLARLRGWL